MSTLETTEQNPTNPTEFFTQDILERLTNLSMFDPAAEVNAHCDEMMIEISLAADSAVQHIKTSEAAMIDEVNTYRANLLSSDLWCEHSSAEPFTAYSPSRQRLLVPDKWRKEIDDLFAQSNALDTINRGPLLDRTLRADINQRLAQKTRDLKREMWDVAFQRRYLRFYANELFTHTLNPFGRLGYDYVVGRRTDKRTFRIGKFEYDLSAQLPRDMTCTLVKCVNSELVVFCSAQGHFVLCKVKQNKKPSVEVFKFENRHISVFYLTPTAIFGIGDKNGKITEFDIRSLATIRSYTLDSSEIADFHVCKDGRLVFMTRLNIIIIDPKAEKMAIEITWPECVNVSLLGELSNGYLVTISGDDKMGSVTRIWNNQDGKLVSERIIGPVRVTAMAVLSNDQVAVAFKDGSLRVMSLVDESVNKCLIAPRNDHEFKHTWTDFIEVVSSEYVIIAINSLKSPQLQLWNMITGELVQSIDTGFTSPIIACSVCPIQNRVVAATSGPTSNIKSWTMILQVVQ